ncbi:MAG TPA: alcohol dehydrogenase catalytic domain-containing protein [Blastocatellia bacterium]|nr:alcohol dehydrogenase catalytic domain-containing protein [Blastocatellia bacterium]
MAKTMRASVLADVGRFELRNVPRPETGPQDVTVQVAAVGLCGTDFHIFAGHANYNTDSQGRPIPLSTHPQILGHEIAGVVAEVGDEVNDLRAGDRVVVDQGLNCRSARRIINCEYCATGDSHQCEFYGEHGITGLPGGLAEYITVPAVNAVRIQSDLDSAEAALTEPLGCIVHSSDMAQRARARYAINADEKDRRVRSVLICGAGPAGLLFTQYLRNVLGFDGLLLVSEPNARRRELAARFGAKVINPTTCDVREAVREMTGGRRVEYLIEATGAGKVFAMIPGLIRKQATVLLYGHGHAGVDLSVLNNVMFLEPALIASVGASGGFEADGRPSTYRRALGLLEEGRVKVAPFITHRYNSLAAVPQAFAGDQHLPDYVKGVVCLT